MPVEQITQSHRKDNDVLEIIYSKDLSDDNMDKYVQQFYDMFLRQIEQRLYAGRLPAHSVRIVISNFKFCKIGYCKTKKIKEITLTSYRDTVQYKQISFKHQITLDTMETARIAKNAVQFLID